MDTHTETSNQAHLEVVPHDRLMQVTPIGGRGFAHHRLGFVPAGVPGRLEFGCIKLFATETIAAGSGYPMHEHKNGEIISLVRQGTVVHQNTLGPTELISTDTVAVISAGRGIKHAELADPSTACCIVQIVLEPRSLDADPRAEHAIVPRAQRYERFRPLASGRGCDADSGALYIDQDAALCSRVFAAGTRGEYAVARGRIAYLLSLDAAVRVNGRAVDANERVLVRQACTLQITAHAETEVLVLDMLDTSA